MSDAPLSFGPEEPLPLTGERTAPGIPEENYWFQRHVAGYEFAASLIDGMRVLDAGCGEGYGSDLLAGTARATTGVDLEPAVLERAARRYPRVRFETANLVALPYRDGSFDAVVSLQVIEHLHTPQEFIAEVARVLTPSGVFIVSTPNRLTFSPEGVRNPFHTFEFAPGELSSALARQFAGVEMHGVFHGWRIRLWERAMRSSFPERLIVQPAPEWPRRLRRRVEKVRPTDFEFGREDLDASLDLLAVARR